MRALIRAERGWQSQYSANRSYVVASNNGVGLLKPQAVHPD